MCDLARFVREGTGWDLGRTLNDNRRNIAGCSKCSDSKLKSFARIL